MQMAFMTKRHLGLSKFLKELAFVAEYFKWDDPGQKAFRDTCYIRGYQNGMRFCPITAVACALKGVNYSPNRWPLAAKIMDVPHDLAEMVVKAADGGVAFDGEMGDLHERLLKAVGL